MAGITLRVVTASANSYFPPRKRSHAGEQDSEEADRSKLTLLCHTCLVVKAILAQSLQTAEPNVTNNSTLAAPLQEYNGYLQGLLVLAIVVAFVLVLKSVL